MKKKSYKLNKLERDRFSLFSDNKNKCYFCHRETELTWHEIYSGKNRQNSMRYGLCLRMCLSCHNRLQEDKLFNDLWHEKGQMAFEKAYPNLNFINIFHRNYLDK